eukprot:8033741-Pyramimonas_sp.AAC.1
MFDLSSRRPSVRQASVAPLGEAGGGGNSGRVQCDGGARDAASHSEVAFVGFRFPVRDDRQPASIAS